MCKFANKWLADNPQKRQRFVREINNAADNVNNVKAEAITAPRYTKHTVKHQ